MTELEPELDERDEAPRGLKKQRTLLAFVGLATAFALVVGPLALFKNNDPQEPGPTLFEATENVSKDRDIKPNGSSVGDEFLLSQTLAGSTGAGTTTGTADTTCTYVRIVREEGNATPMAVAVQCTGVATFGQDELTYQGLNSFTPGGASISKFVVTGGTGSYADAKGEVRVTETGAGTSTFAFDLTKPGKAT